jgi:hypothetical protein
MTYQIFGAFSINGRKHRHYLGEEDTEKAAWNIVLAHTAIGSDCAYAYMKSLDSRNVIHLKIRSRSYDACAAA